MVGYFALGQNRPIEQSESIQVSYPIKATVVIPFICFRNAAKKTKPEEADTSQLHTSSFFLTVREKVSRRTSKPVGERTIRNAFQIQKEDGAGRT
jgi:hypothetical protein